MFTIIMSLNAIWCFMAFYNFSIQYRQFAKAVVRNREHRQHPLFDTVGNSGRFLGGMNAAFCLLALLLVIFSSSFPEANQRIILCTVFAAAHFSQFYFNVPVLRENRNGDGVWPVMQWPMVFVFITDIVMTLLNLVMVVWLLC